LNPKEKNDRKVKKKTFFNDLKKFLFSSDKIVIDWYEPTNFSSIFWLQINKKFTSKSPQKDKLF